MLKEKILIVDDDPDILDVLKITLEAEGYQVAEAHDGEEAIKMIKKSYMTLMEKIPMPTGRTVEVWDKSVSIAEDTTKVALLIRIPV